MSAPAFYFRLRLRAWSSACVVAIGAAAPCACGQRGCVEAYVGGSYVERRIRDELAAVDEYQYVVVNDKLEKAIKYVSSVIDAESIRRDRTRALDEQVARIIEQLEQQLDLTSAPADV